MTGPRIGSLFSGYDGLGMAVADVLGGTPAWFSDNAPAPSRVLARHWPGVPNHGDITRMRWSAVEPVDILTGGFPCQDISSAGLGAGMAGRRSGLWVYMAQAIDHLRPATVVIENVRAILSAKSVIPLQLCPVCMADTAADGAVRALGAVLGDLAAIGYDAQWLGLRASDVGAPHRRDRIFIVAVPAADPDAGRRHRRGGRAEGRRAQPAVSYRPAADTDGPRFAGVGRSEHVGRDADRRGSADTVRDTAQSAPWGKYTPAVEQWERLTRPAPAPTITGARGGAALAPVFVEWLMGLPEGYVTTPALGLSVSRQLTLLGNGVVPQQAAAALRLLLPLIGARP